MKTFQKRIFSSFLSRYQQQLPLQAHQHKFQSPVFFQSIFKNFSTKVSFTSGRHESGEEQSSDELKEVEHKFSFKACAYSIPKMRRNDRPYNLTIDTLSSEESDAGEDGFFIARTDLLNDQQVDANHGHVSEERNTRKETKDICLSIGVADGVGGWSASGVDPSLVSRQLMKNSLDYSLELTSKNIYLNPMNILQKAYDKLVEESNIKAGTTTACIVALNPDETRLEERAVVSAANLGDSGFMILRKMEESSPLGEDLASELPEQEQSKEEKNPIKFGIVSRTSEQQVFFNAPYQIGIVPNEQREGSLRFYPKDAQDIKGIQVQADDIVVLATDGLFDNLFDETIINIVAYEMKVKEEQGLDDDQFLFNCAKTLCLLARKTAKDMRAMTPFSVHASQHGYFAPGGKLDDITTVVAKITKI